MLHNYIEIEKFYNYSTSTDSSSSFSSLVLLFFDTLAFLLPLAFIGLIGKLFSSRG